jgi:hypothetical protein
MGKKKRTTLLEVENGGTMKSISSMDKSKNSQSMVSSTKVKPKMARKVKKGVLEMNRQRYDETVHPSDHANESSKKESSSRSLDKIDIMSTSMR